MYAITGITGQVGGAVARSLLAAGQKVRAIVRDAAKAEAWKARGCDIALADIADAAALTEALHGVEAVFLLIPPNFDPSEGFPEVRALARSLRATLLAANPGRVVCLSTIGAQATQPNLLSQLGLVEQALGDLPMPIAFLRAAWFMENAAWDVPAARDGVVPSFLQPLDKPVPMVATADIGRLGAALLRERWTGRRVVELEGPRRVTPNEVAAAFAGILGRPVRMQPVPRDTWEALFRSQGMHNPTPRAQMLDGFNAGWIEFEGTPLRGETTIDTVLAELVRAAG
jgi:NAD(P)H dehydrogenase (quinone)